MHSHYSFQTECISLLNYTFVKFKLNLIKHTVERPLAIQTVVTCVSYHKALHAKTTTRSTTWR